MKRISLILLSSFYALSLSAQTLTLQSLQSHLSRNKRSWTAGETKLSSLSREELKRFLGSTVSPSQDYFAAVPSKHSSATRAASSFDWRNVGGKTYSSPVLDQGHCGSCVAFAAIGQLETQLNIKRNTTNSPWAFSPQHLFSCGGGVCEDGWQPASALQFLAKTGVPDEACFPYRSGSSGDDYACSQSCSNAKDRSLRISGWQMESFFFYFPDSIKKALKKGPLLATMTVYEDFTFYKGGVYQHTTGEELGGHAVVIEGWSDADKAWIVRNSWGTGWGENGYFRVAYNDDSGVGKMAWSMEVPGRDGAVTLGSLRDRELFSGANQSLSLESTYTDTRRIRWQLLQGTAAKLTGEVARSSNAVIDTTQLADGIYEVQAIAERDSGMEYSQPRQVYVLNGPHTGTVDFIKPRSGATLSGKETLQLSATYAPVPFSKIVFKAKNVATGQLVTRETPHVASRLELNFQTAKLDNGDWELSLDGVIGSKTVSSRPLAVTIRN
jgi:hypothetical protein